MNGTSLLPLKWIIIFLFIFFGRTIYLKAEEVTGAANTEKGTLSAPPSNSLGEKTAPVSAPPSVSIPIGDQEEYRYDPTVGRDPFKPYRNLRPSLIANRPATGDGLPAVDLDKLQVVGIIWDIKSPRAMLIEKGNSKQIHIVQLNSKIGRNNGVVKAIREGEVVVVESDQIDGNTIYSTKVLEINR